MTPVYCGPTEWMADVDFLVRADMTLSLDCKADLQAAMKLNPLRRITGAVERLYIEQVANPSMSDRAKGVMGATAQQIFAWRLGPHGQPSEESESGRAYDIWQGEKVRQGDSDADTTVTPPLPLEAWNDISIPLKTVPFPPTVLSVSPATASDTGNTNLTLTGNALKTTADVSIGGEPAKFLALSDTELTVVAQGGPVGEADVVVTTKGGSSAAFKGFSYVKPPA